MYTCYVDETGTDGDSPLLVMVGILADGSRLRRTAEDFDGLYADLAAIPDREVRELKTAHLYRGKKAWQGVDGTLRRKVMDDLCEWIGERKHQLALAAIPHDAIASDPLRRELDAWMTGALHIALQVQRHQQSKPKAKGRTFLIFDEHVKHADSLPALLCEPPSWTDGYYDRGRKQAAFDQIVDTALYARSHHIGLVQVADLFAYQFRRYVELVDFGADPYWEGEFDELRPRVEALAGRLLPSSCRWPKRTEDGVASWYTGTAPRSLLAFG